MLCTLCTLTVDIVPVGQSMDYSLPTHRPALRSTVTDVHASGSVSCAPSLALMLSLDQLCAACGHGRRGARITVFSVLLMLFSELDKAIFEAGFLSIASLVSQLPNDHQSQWPTAFYKREVANRH